MSYHSTFFIASWDADEILQAIRQARCPVCDDDQPDVEHAMHVVARRFEPSGPINDPATYLAYEVSQRWLIGGGNHLDPADLVALLRTVKGPEGYPAIWSMTFAQESDELTLPWMNYSSEDTDPGAGVAP